MKLRVSPWITSLTISLFCITLCSGQIASRIGVDPGHGGSDGGAVGPTGLTEKQVNLSTALALRDYLQADGATVFITRTTDTTVTLTTRTNYFMSNGVNRAISVHHNSGGSTTNTTMDFVYCGRCFSTGGNLASSIIQRVGTQTGLTVGPAISTAAVLCPGRSDWSCGRDGVGQANLHMVREPELGAQIPSVLVEVSFISNASEEARLKNADYLDGNGWAIYAGVADHFGVNPKPRSGQCSNSTATLRNRDGGPPIHPPGTVIKTASSSTVYLIDPDNRKRPITSSSVLAQLYNQSTDARTSTNFTSWVITVGQDELDLYETGGNISAAQPGNGKPFPDGKLIGFSGEVSIVTGTGKRRPFADGSRFTALGYNFCHVVNISQSEYNSYAEGPPVDAMPLLISSVNLSPSGPYMVGQSISGTFTIKNVGYSSIPFLKLGIGGRFNGDEYDLSFVAITLGAGSSHPFGSQARQLTSAGNYDFFAAYQENNQHWAISVPAAPGVIRSRQITVATATTRTMTVASSNPNSGVSITVSPNDNNGSSNGTTQFSRTYNNNTNVNLTAPTTAGGNDFQKWQRNGADWSTNRSTSVTMDANYTMTAVYVTPPPVTRTLTVTSSNPNSGVSVTVSPTDNNGSGNGTTQFTRTYNNNTNVNLTAPSTAGGNDFQKWQRNGSDWSTNRSTSVTTDASYTMTAVYVTPPPVTRMLTVASLNPNSGVSVTVSPTDNNGSGNGTTQFTRSYNNNTGVNLTAASTAGGNNFQKWQRNGSDWSVSQSTSVTMDASYTMTAVYMTPAVTRTLTVASSNPSSGVSITINPTDNNGSSNGTTQFTRTYNNNTGVTLSAPATASGNDFQKWQRDGSDWSTNQSTSVTMDANHTMTVVYTTPASTRTLTVASSNPSSGVIITVSPTDNNGSGNGTTQFTRTYNNNTNMTLTAPSTAGGNNFQKWQLDGVDFTTSLLANFVMDANHTMTAVYVSQSSGNTALYDSVLKAPKCGQPGNVCDSGTLLDGRDNISGGPETNQPNTIFNSCADSSVGTYHVDESIDRIKLSTVDGSNFSPGKTVKVEATVWAWSGITSDFLDLYYANDAANPTWTYLTTLAPSVTGVNLLSTTYTLPSGSLQALRAHFRWSGSASPCGGVETFDDYDDLIFAVGADLGQQFQLLLEQFGPVANQALSVDAILMLRDPFPVLNNWNALNSTSDKNTRVMVYLANFQLAPGETSSSVVVNLVDSIGQSFDVAAQDVRGVPNSSFTQVTFRLPTNLAVGTCTISVKARGQTSNSGTIRIRA